MQPLDNRATESRSSVAEQRTTSAPLQGCDFTGISPRVRNCIDPGYEPSESPVGWSSWSFVAGDGCEVPWQGGAVNEIWSLDATAQAELVATGRVGAVDLVSAAIERAESLSSLASTTVLFKERAMQQAVAATGPFAGVPILLKDAGQQIAGTPHWIGTKALKSIGYESEVTTPLVVELEDLGFVIIGKAAVPELMTGVTTEPPIGPPTRNPWNPSLTVGGSSGGSAAAVAARIVPIAHGSDSTGSLRYPASCCGVFSLKPTVGRVTSQLPADIEDPLGMHADFVLSRSVRDLQRVFDGLAARWPSPVGEVRRIGVLESMPFGLEMDPAVHDAIAEVAELLAPFHEVVPIKPEFLERYGSVLGSEVATLIDANRSEAVSWIEKHLGRTAVVDDLSEVILEAAERGRSQSPDDVISARQRIDRAATEARRWVAEADALLLPILSVVPWRIGQSEPDGLLAGLVCSLANFSGQPSVAIPTIQNGVPVGVQLQGPQGSDETLLAIAAHVRPTSPTPPQTTR